MIQDARSHEIKITFILTQNTMTDKQVEIQLSLPAGYTVHFRHFFFVALKD
jgi:hypothetical protein